MKVRIISAIVALAIFIPLLILGKYPFAIAMGILSILAYKEILDLKKSHGKIPDLVKALGVIALIILVLGNYGDGVLGYNFLLVPCVLLLLPTVFYDKNKYTTQDAIYLLGATFLIGMLFNLIITIRNTNLYVLIYLLSISIITDTFAYAVGCLIGKHKMATKISPLKSWEGFGAGLVAGTIIPLIIYTNLVGDFSIKILLITICLSFVGQIGDLFFSKIKRDNDIKDFSNIMPGHGGILDRVDSICFILFVYVILVWTL